MIDLIAYSLAAFMLLLVMYVVLFKLYYMGHRPWWLYPAALVFIVLDFLINATVMSILTLDFPTTWTVTERMKDYKKIKNKTGLNFYRYHLAENLCLILNVFDKSDDGHC